MISASLGTTINASQRSPGLFDTIVQFGTGGLPRPRAIGVLFSSLMGNCCQDGIFEWLCWDIKAMSSRVLDFWTCNFSRAHEFLPVPGMPVLRMPSCRRRQDNRSLKGLGNRPIKGYDEVMPVLDLVQRHPRPKPMGNSLAPEYKMHSATR